MNIGITVMKKIMLVFILNSDQLYAIIWAHFIALAHSYAIQCRTEVKRTMAWNLGCKSFDQSTATNWV